MSLQNLAEDFLYDLLPSGLIDLDTTRQVQAIIGGYQDRICDERSYVSKYEYFFQTSGLPEVDADGNPTNNTVLVTFTSDVGKVITRSLDILPDTPTDSESLLDWAKGQLNLDDDSRVISAQYAPDLLRLVDTNTLDYLAATIGAILYQTASQNPENAITDAQRLLSTWFPRLKFKGTPKSFESLGKLLGFDDVRMVPLWGRVVPHIPDDIGNGSNNSDFAAIPDFYPKPDIDIFYDPLDIHDGPFMTWSGTAGTNADSVNYYPTLINGNCPFFEVATLTSPVTNPEVGSYVLTGGASNVKASVYPDSSMKWQSVVDGDASNGISISVSTADSGSSRFIQTTARLSSIKYRTSYYDIATTMLFENAEALFGSVTVRKNKDLEDDPDSTNFGQTAQSPYKPWTDGTMTPGFVNKDYLVTTDSTTLTVVEARTQATYADRQIATDDLMTAGVQAVQAMEEVRPATRLIRSATTGFLVRDQLGYAAYNDKSFLFTAAVGNGTYWGTATDYPLPDFHLDSIVTQKTTFSGTLYGESDISDSELVRFQDGSGTIAGTFSYSNNQWQFVANPTQEYDVFAVWEPATTEIIRTEPSKTGTHTYGYQIRPEDSLADPTMELVDDYPWRRDIVVGGEDVDLTIFDSVAESAIGVSETVAVPDHTGADYLVVAFDTVSDPIRLQFEARPTLSEYAPGQRPIGFQGTFRDISTLTDAEKVEYNPANVTTTGVDNVIDDLDRVFESGYSLYQIGLVQGIPVADPVKFYGPHHRDHIASWIPFMDHPEDDLLVSDKQQSITVQTLSGILPEDRKYDSTRGLNLYLRPQASMTSTGYRDITTEFSLSFWMKALAPLSASESDQAILSFGPIELELQSNTAYWALYYYNTAGTRTLVDVLVILNGWNFFQLTYSQTNIRFGAGTLGSSATPTDYAITGPEFSQEDSLVVKANGRGYYVQDLRIWDAVKTDAELDLVRYHSPNALTVPYRIGWFNLANNMDRYGLKVLASGFITPEKLPAWLKTERLGRVIRYNSSGLYMGEDRRKEVGLGGGRSIPGTVLLGQQSLSLTGDGTVVYAPTLGEMPGISPKWQAENYAGKYLYLDESTVGATGITASEVTSPNSVPWPYRMQATNPNRDFVWVRGDDGLVYQVSLDTSVSPVVLQAELVTKTRTDAELALNDVRKTVTTSGSVSVFVLTGNYPGLTGIEAGTSTTIDDGATSVVPSGQITGGYVVPATGEVSVLTGNGVTEVTVTRPSDFSVSELLTGAQVILSGTSPAGTLTVDSDGLPYIWTAYSGTVTTPPLYLYAHEQIVAKVDNAYDVWDDPNDFGSQQTPPVAALNKNGSMNFRNTATAVAGNYRLEIQSGNIGLVDSAFNGFKVEITLGEAVIETRLLQGHTGADFTEIDTLEFALSSALSGEWLLGIKWFDALSNSSKGTARQLKILSYTLSQIKTTLHEITIPASGTEPGISLPLHTEFADVSSTPGSWLAWFNSYGTVKGYTHEIDAYSSNDTVTIKDSLSNQLTGSTDLRTEDIYCFDEHVLVDSGTASLPSFGGLTYS